jgi:transposase
METSSLLNDAPSYWEISDERWEAIRTLLLKHDPPRVTGRRRIDQRAALNAMIYRARTNCRWNKMPKHLPDDSSVHRTMQRWVKLGVFAEIWQIVVAPTAQPEATERVAESNAAPVSGLQTVTPAAEIGALTEKAA